MKYPLNIGCTTARHERLGVNATVNARAGLQFLNDDTLDAIELQRDAANIRARLSNRVRFYQFGSKFFNRHRARFAHLLSRFDD